MAFGEVAGGCRPGILVGVARKGGTWAVVKTVTVGYAIYMDTKIAEGIAQDAGVSDQTIREVELAAAVITLILLHKVPPEPIPESPPPKPATHAPAEPGTPPPAPESPPPPAVPRLQAATAKDAIKEITEIAARTSGDGATKAAQFKALLEQAARQGIKGPDGTTIGFEMVQGKDGSTIFLGGPGGHGTKPAVVITPNGDVYSGGSSLTGREGVTHFGYEYTPDYNRLKKIDLGISRATRRRAKGRSRCLQILLGSTRNFGHWCGGSATTLANGWFAWSLAASKPAWIGRRSGHVHHSIVVTWPACAAESATHASGFIGPWTAISTTA